MRRSLVALVFLAAAPVVAQSSVEAGNFYFGLGLGESVEGGHFAQSLEEFGVQAADQARKVFAGAVLSKRLAVEGSYYDFGSRSCCPRLADAGFETELDGFAAALDGCSPSVS